MTSIRYIRVDFRFWVAVVVVVIVEISLYAGSLYQGCVPYISL